MERTHAQRYFLRFEEFFIIGATSNPFSEIPNNFICTISKDIFHASEAALELFNNSPKFIPTPRNCCHAKVVKGVDEFLHRYKWRFFRFSHRRPCRFKYSSTTDPPDECVPSHALHTCRIIKHALASILRSCKHCFPSADNITPAARCELERLRQNSDIVITPVDKGGSWMIVPKDSYVAEGMNQLSDRAFYAEQPDDLSDSIRHRLTALLSGLYKRGFISGREFKALEPPQQPSQRFFYLLPKAHKSEWSFVDMPKGRPIVSDTGSISRRCASFVEYFLAPLARRARSYIRDSVHLISSLDSVVIDVNTLLFTMDIRSLYTNIPLEEGIAAVSKAFIKFPDVTRPDLTLLSMLRLLLTSNYFSFQSRHFLQLQGTAMGCAFGASYANIFLSEWEDRIYAHPNSPTHWFRYIDDCLGIWDHGLAELESFVVFVNSIFPSIQVEVTVDRNAIRFLDLELYICQARLLYKIGFKSTDNHVILSPFSYHPTHTFRSILFAQVYRWMTRSATYNDFKATKKTVQRRWRQQGYTRSKIRDAIRSVFFLTQQTPTLWVTGFFPCTNDCSICTRAFFAQSVVNNFNNASFRILHRLSCNSCNVIYLIVCTKCKVMYVGQTGRSLCVRIKEHLRNILSNHSTSVSIHFNSTCTIDHFSFTAIEHVPSEAKRLVKENKWMDRLQTLQPHGLNEMRNREADQSLRLILPYSLCSRRIFSLCRQTIKDFRVTAGHTTNRNLRSILRHRQK